MGEALSGVVSFFAFMRTGANKRAKMVNLGYRQNLQIMPECKHKETYHGYNTRLETVRYNL